MKFCPDCGAKTKLEIPKGDNRLRFVCEKCSAGGVAK